MTGHTYPFNSRLAHANLLMRFIVAAEADLHLSNGSQNKLEIQSYDEELLLAKAKIDMNYGEFLFFEGKQNTKT